MKPIIINENNINKIENLLTDIQGKANKRLCTLEDIKLIPSLVKAFKNKYYLSWENIENCFFVYDTYVSQGSKYKYHNSISYTEIQIVVSKAKCRVYSIERKEDFDGKENIHKFHASFLTREAQVKILENIKYL